MRPATLSLFLSSLLLFSSGAGALTPPAPTPLPLIAAPVNAKEQPVTVRRFDVTVHAIGAQADTVIDLEIHNPNRRQLEGTLQFPLQPHQRIVGFALDVNGEMRDAVPVPKAQGRQIFEEVTRGRVDPGLLENTAGNAFRLRVYPVPPGGVRKARLWISETLPAGPDGRYHYDLSSQRMRWDGQTQVDFKVELPEAIRSQAQIDQLSVSWPIAKQPAILSGAFDGERFFAAELAPPLSKKPRRPPAVIGLLWDSSASVAADPGLRSHYLRRLQDYLAGAERVEVRLIRLRDRAEAPQSFVVENGRADALLKALEDTAYDGATALDGWTPQAEVGEYLLFSDGLSNYGGDFPTLSPRQRLLVFPRPQGDQSRLAALAQRYGACLGYDRDDWRIDRELSCVQSVTAEGADKLAPDLSAAPGGVLRLAGRMQGERATVKIKLLVDGEPREIELPVQPGAEDAGPAAARRWAQYRSDALSVEASPSARAEMRALGRRFRLVNKETSLLVLENVADYVRYDIEPPAVLLKEYRRLQQAGAQERDRRRERHVEDLVRQYESKIAWWQTSYPKDSPPPPKPEIARSMAMEAMPAAPAAGMAPPPPAPAPVASEPPLPRAEAMRKRAGGPPGGAPDIGITLKPWKADSPLMRRFAAARPDQLYALYLKERAANANSTAFFLDVADLLLQRGQRDLALRVLSNLAEMELENRHILRILGYRLLQAGEPKLAIPVFERVREMGEEEPQSFRDLGLAYEAAGRHQEAADQWVEVVNRTWDGRFPEIELITLAELNALDARVGPLKIALDRRLKRNLPLDLRAVLTWDADNSDMDLWVTDPNGEKCFYSNPLTYQGGRMSRDFTGGYGPEEFSLRHAKPGKYKVEVNFYGHRQQIVAGATTLQLKLTTGFGGKRSKDKMVTLRLKGEGQTVMVGEFEVPARR